MSVIFFAINGKRQIITPGCILPFFYLISQLYEMIQSGGLSHALPEKLFNNASCSEDGSIGRRPNDAAKFLF